ncbi:MAG: hypothetical protein LBP61_07285 [Desulfovibrio sp.]|jgi:predicted dienelactone hydrolase|nr:hypothetical protein [Desulfovibrio sp.]
MGSKSGKYGVGMQTFGVWENVEGGRFDFVLFFPSLSQGRTLVREGWRLQAAEGARPLPGLYPVVLLSHDTAGSRFANSDVAEALAGSGFFVIAPTHSGDNQNNGDSLHTADLLFTRPRQILLALETVLSSPVFAPYADESRIGLLGVGFGSVTVLQLAGFRPDPSRMEASCAHAGEGHDPFCTSWARSRLAHLPAEAAALEEKWGGGAFTPPLDLYAPALEPSPGSLRETPPVARPAPSLADRILVFFSFPASPETPPATETPLPAGNAAPPVLIPDFDGGPLFGSGDSRMHYAYLALPGPSPLPEASPVEENPPLPAPALEDKPVVHRRPATLRRIRALALLAPAGGMFFPRNAPAESRLPALVIEAGKDELYAPEQHSRPYLSLLPAQVRLAQLAEADHFSLFAPCSDEIRENLEAACGRMGKEEGLNIRRRRDEELISFFRSFLAPPLETASPSGLVASPVFKEENLPEAGIDASPPGGGSAPASPEGR